MTFNPRKKVMAIGLDSATPVLIERWVEEGKLPVFKRLMKTGSYGRLTSTIPALTPPAWTTSMTGVNPGKHNLYDFFCIQADNKKKIVNAGDKRSKAIWNLLDDHGRRSIIINLPITYPAETFNGVMITGMPTPTVKKGFVSPEHLKEFVLGLTGGKQLAVDIHHLLRGDKTAFLKDLEAVTDRISRIAMHFMENEDWDFFMVVFDDLDRIQHTFWHYMDPAHPLYNQAEARQYQDAILTFHQFLEQQIEKLLSCIDDDTMVIIFSDHGMGPVYRNFYINRFLEEQGWLKVKKQFIKPKEILQFLGLSQKRIRLFLSAIGLRTMARQILPESIKTYIKKHFPAEELELEFFDWSKILEWDETKAYLCSRTGQGILINKDNVKDYEAFRDEIIQALKELKDPETGRYAVKRVYKKEEVYHGPYTEQGPDIIIEPADTFELQEKLSEKVFENVINSQVPISANHVKEGILIVRGGPNLQQGQIFAPDIVDITPTILYYLGYPIPSEMDGKVMTEVFSKKFCAEHPIRYDDISLAWNSGRDRISAMEKSAIIDRLRDLGYME